ncbi:MAG: peptidase M23, partial [Gammaproteobacteria bacterium]|nr:peptidase M23 [Gammaproteobacteria bacterium]
MTISLELEPRPADEATLRLTQSVLDEVPEAAQDEAESLEPRMDVIDTAQGLQATADADGLIWQTFEVQSGDTLAALFKRAGHDEKQMYAVLDGDKKNKSLSQLYRGEKIAFAQDDQGLLQQVRLDRGRLESLVIRRVDDQFIAEKIVKKPDVVFAHATGVITDSLFMAGRRAKLPDAMTLELANIFGWDIDFALDIRKGDQFSVVYEELFLDGRKIGNGRILAASFRN